MNYYDTEDVVVFEDISCCVKISIVFFTQTLKMVFFDGLYETAWW
jgi:hypothetical protein